MTSLVTGMVLALATGPSAGKETRETALFDKLRRGDLVLADRYSGCGFMLALLRELGVEFVTRLF